MESATSSSGPPSQWGLRQNDHCFGKNHDAAVRAAAAEQAGAGLVLGEEALDDRDSGLHELVPDAPPSSASRFSTKAWRSSSESPQRFNSNVKPCSKR